MQRIQKRLLIVAAIGYSLSLLVPVVAWIVESHFTEPPQPVNEPKEVVIIHPPHTNKPSTVKINQPTTTKKQVDKWTKIELDLIRHMLKKGVPKERAEEYASLIVKYSNKYGVDPYVILAMIEVESNYIPNKEGKYKEKGLLQILPSTQKYMGIEGDLFNPAVNIEVGCKYLAYTQKKFGYELGIVAYNQGEGNVRRGTYKTWYLEKVKKVLSTIEKS